MVVKIKDMKMFLSMFLFMLPTALFQIPGISTVWYILLFISIAFFVVSIRADFFYVARNQKGGFITTFFLVLHILTQAIATYYNGGSPTYNLLTAVVVFFLCMYFAFYISSTPFDTLVVFKSVVGFLVFFELVLYILGYSWLGSIQIGYLYYVVWATLSLLVSKKCERPNREIFGLTLLFLIIITLKPQINEDGSSNYEWTFYIVAIIFMSYFFLEKLLKDSKIIFNPKFVFGAIIGLNLIFVVFQSQEQSSILKFLIEDVMHKNIDITGRSGIWHFAKYLIMERPIWGYGTGLISLKTEGYWYDFMKLYGPHNQFLYLILAGGIFTLLAYIFLLFVVFRQLNQKKNFWGTPIMCLGLFCVYLLLLVTYRTIGNSMPFFALLVIISTLCARNFDFVENDVKKESLTEIKE